ncbi:MAG: hypothetical protein GC157_11755 [Frankiales bacterium]|nr:hypothetical protein [Frankiales bacterium]
MTRLRLPAGLALAALLLAACSSGPAPQPADSATLPRVTMTGPESGYAVWPSGVRWIVLSTTDGWRTVTNRTPVAVPTDGGVVLAAQPGRLTLGVLPFQALTVSPVLTSDGSTRQWNPTQLPSALAATAGALARTGSTTWAVLADGSLVRQDDGAATWTTAAAPGSLPLGDGSPTGIWFTPDGTGFVTVSRHDDGPLLLVSDDSGATWRDSGLRAAGSDVAARPPCRLGSSYAVPVQADDHLLVLTASSSAGPWTAGPALPASGQAVVSCAPASVVAAAPSGGGDAVYAAAPGAAWAQVGSTDTRLVSLDAVSDTRAFAADDDAGRVLDLALGPAPAVTEVPLPDWVATIGGGAMRT